MALVFSLNPGQSASLKSGELRITETGEYHVVLTWSKTGHSPVSLTRVLGRQSDDILTVTPCYGFTVMVARIVLPSEQVRLVLEGYRLKSDGWCVVSSYKGLRWFLPVVRYNR